MYVEAQLIALNNARSVATRAAGRPPGPEGAVNKILQAGHTQRLQELFVDVAGARGVAWSASDDWFSSNGWAFLRVRAKTIAGGTSEILRNQVAERVLGLPRDDDPTLGVPWSDVMVAHSGQRKDQ
jgi:alkylation response protein AidB-like acyl-CoA dehydrogenase